MSGYQTGTRVRDTRSQEVGTITRGGTGLTRLVAWDAGGSEYVSVDYLALDAPPRPDTPPPLALSEAVAASETPGDDAPILPDPPATPPVEPAREVKQEDPRRAAPGRPLWTREAIIERIKDWAERHGSPPTTKDWEKGDPLYPSAMTVKTRFGSWAAAIEAAGYPRPVKGTRKKGQRNVAAAAPGESGTTTSPPPGRGPDSPARVDAPTPGSGGVAPGAHTEPQPPRAPQGSPIAKWLASITTAELRAEGERIEAQIADLTRQLALVGNVLKLKEAA